LLAVGFVVLWCTVAASARLAGAADGYPFLVWTSLPPDRDLFGHAAVMDPFGDRMILLGGERDVNEPPFESRQLRFASLRWSTHEARGEAPASRHGGIVRGASVALDTAEQVVALSCDCANGGTHLLDLASDTWQRAPGDHERTVSGALLAYDPGGDQLVRYGGLERSLPPAIRAGMAYDMSDARRGWRDLPDAPFQLTSQAVAYVAGARHVLAFGGQDVAGEATDALWRLDLDRLGEEDAWRRIESEIGDWPSPRMGASLTMDPASDTGVLFGGYTLYGEPHDHWILDYSEPDEPLWRQLDVETGPASRAGHSAVWDAARTRVTIYGGVSSTPGVRVWHDTWTIAGDAQVSRRLFVPSAAR
jgi:hypothetical protein